MHIEELRRRHDQLCVELHQEAVQKTNKLVDGAYDVFSSNSFNFSVPASRNVYQSRIYSNILSYLLVTKLWEFEVINVEVDSKALRNLLSQYAKKNRINADVSLNIAVYFGELLKVPVRFIRVLVKMLRIRKLAKRISCFPKEKGRNAIFIDTDLLVGSFHKNGYSNRSFGSFFDYLKPDERGRLYLIPRLLAVSDFKKLYEEVALYQKASGIKIFCKESAFTCRQYLVIAWKWVSSFVLGFKKSKLEFFGLISEELRLKAFSEITFESFISFYFMKLLKVDEIPVRTFLNWNENHLYDRAYAKAVADFDLNFRFVAYQGVILDLDYDFYIEPTVREIEMGLFPKTVFIAGGELNETAFNCGGVKTLSAPVFRMGSYLLDRDISHLKNSTNKLVLVGLSLVPKFSEEIMQIAKLLAKSFPEYEFKVRCHPLLKMKLPDGISNMSYDSEIDVINSLKNSSLLIGAGSSLVLEAALMQVPTLIVRKLGEHEQNPIPSRLRSIFTSVVTVESDLKNEFTRIVSGGESVRDQRKHGADLIFTAYVKAIGRGSVEEMIG